MARMSSDVREASAPLGVSQRRGSARRPPCCNISVACLSYVIAPSNVLFTKDGRNGGLL